MTDKSSKKSDPHNVGPDEMLVRHISATKKEPEWMLELRLKALALWQATPMPNWGPDLSGLDLEGMTYYVDPNVKETDDWKELPKEITDTFEKLGIPKAERDYLGGCRRAIRLGCRLSPHSGFARLLGSRAFRTCR